MKMKNGELNFPRSQERARHIHKYQINCNIFIFLAILIASDRQAVAKGEHKGMRMTLMPLYKTKLSDINE